MTDAALDGVRVVDLSRVLAGPYCTMMLGDLGAEVIKVEQPGFGDGARQWGPPWVGKESAYFLSANRNKKSMTLNLKHTEGQRLVRELIASTDVLVENFRPGTTTKLGLDYETLAAEFPSLIYCSITGYGQNGPYRERSGYDFMIQAQGGLLSITGPEGGPPSKVGVAIVDITAGLFAASAILAALFHRKQTGEGQHIDIA
ncbi:MAG: CaiB/BaiF CoA transferase family protein, partial [Anaerolineales bacterium]